MKSYVPNISNFNFKVKNKKLRFLNFKNYLVFLANSNEIFYLLLFTVEVGCFNPYFFFTSIIIYFFRKVSPIFSYKNNL